jgi:hypothetical protein
LVRVFGVSAWLCLAVRHLALAWQDLPMRCRFQIFHQNGRQVATLSNADNSNKISFDWSLL